LGAETENAFAAFAKNIDSNLFARYAELLERIVDCGIYGIAIRLHEIHKLNLSQRCLCLATGDPILLGDTEDVVHQPVHG